MTTPVIAIVGRPNVGKSTLFNRLTRSRDALVDDRPGVTRDRLYAAVRWNEVPVQLVDTGGLAPQEKGSLVQRIREQVVEAVDQADRIIFMVDGRRGPTPEDREIADMLRRAGKSIFLTINKVDGPEQDALALDFYELGLGEARPISAEHGYGVRGLMDEVMKGLEPAAEDEAEPHRIRVAVVGRPNAGKSSLINKILGMERLLVSDEPGTTRDSVDTPFSLRGRDYLLIDTAGLRRRAKVKERLEKFSMIKTLRSLDRAHVAVVLLDAAAGVAEQDARICGFALERGRALVLGVNKWDLVKGDPTRRREIAAAVERRLGFVSFAPKVHLSALTGQGLGGLFRSIEEVWEPFCTRVGTGELNRAVGEILSEKPPPRAGGGRVKLYYATQTGTRPPTFVVFVNRPDLLPESYRRFLANRIKERFGLSRVPLRIVLRRRESGNR
ncbi:MAG: ribosome biogenesis GTPase Der [Desulfobacteraceae bacterium]